MMTIGIIEKPFQRLKRGTRSARNVLWISLALSIFRWITLTAPIPETGLMYYRGRQVCRLSSIFTVDTGNGIIRKIIFVWARLFTEWG